MASMSKNRRCNITVDSTSQLDLEDLLDEISDQPTEPLVVGNMRKRVRGPTYMPNIWKQAQEDRIKVLFNDLGQPVDEENTSKLTHFMGSMARSGQFCPVDKQWHKVDKKLKKDLLDTLNSRFDLPPGCESWLLQSFGKKVRNWRGRIKKDYYDPMLPLQEQIMKKPPKVHQAQWTNLVKHWNNEEVQIISKKNQENREKRKMVQVTGKKSYARIREEKKKELGYYPPRMDLFVAFYSKDGASKNEEASKAIEQMQELKSQLPEGTLDEPGPDDVLSKVLGKDPQGRARMYGLGVRTSDVWGEVPSRSASHRENMQWKNAYEHLSSEMAEMRALVMEMRSNASNGLNASNGSSVGVGSSAGVASGDHRTTGQQSRPLRDGVEVYLKSITNPSETVAKGWIHSLDPTTEVGGEEIGPNWCEVHIEVPVKRNERLVRPYGLFVTIGDAIGATIAWPCNFITVVEVDVKVEEPGDSNVHNNAFYAEEKLLKSELEAMRDCNPQSARHWIIRNTRTVNRTGQLTGYKLVPGSNCLPLAGLEAKFLRRAAFLMHNLWVTPYAPDEMFPGGEFPNQNPRVGEGLATWVKQNRSLEENDLVLWYVFGLTHVPRLEDWPVMPVERIGFSLAPHGFFNCSPAVDVPPCSPDSDMKENVIVEKPCHNGLIAKL